MIKAEDFELPVDREFTLVKVKKEIDECDDKQALRENLKSLVDQNARFQHLIGKLIEAELKKDLDEFFDYMKEQANESGS